MTALGFLICLAKHRQTGLLVAQLCHERNDEIPIGLLVAIRKGKVEDRVPNIIRELGVHPNIFDRLKAEDRLPTSNLPVYLKTSDRTRLPR